jgi:hypothetical protein
MARVAGNGLAPVTEGKERERMIIGRLTPPSRHSAAILDQHEPIRPPYTPFVATPHDSFE